MTREITISALTDDGRIKTTSFLIKNRQGEVAYLSVATLIAVLHKGLVSKGCTVVVQGVSNFDAEIAKDVLA